MLDPLGIEQQWHQLGKLSKPGRARSRSSQVEPGRARSSQVEPGRAKSRFSQVVPGRARSSK
eukprot:15716270-Heterocapsa_arctica.AAC.1